MRWLQLALPLSSLLLRVLLALLLLHLLYSLKLMSCKICVVLCLRHVAMRLLS